MKQDLSTSLVVQSARDIASAVARTELFGCAYWLGFRASYRLRRYGFISIHVARAENLSQELTQMAKRKKFLSQTRYATCSGTLLRPYCPIS